MTFLVMYNLLGMLKNIKLIVADIDGTLVDDDTHKPTEYSKDVFNRLHNKGVLLGIASGRNVDQVKDMIKDYHMPFEYDLIIGLNGAESYDRLNDHFEHYCDLEPNEIKDIITSMFNSYPDLNPSIYRDGKRICLKDPDDAKICGTFANHNATLNNHIVKDISEFWEKPCGKIMFRVTEKTMEKIWPYAKSLSNDRYYATKTQTTMLEFNNALAIKSNPLKKFCEANNIDLKNVMACGDMTNDDDMILAAGVGVAVANADSHTKEIADVITPLDNNNDGLPKYLEETLLGE